MDMQVAEGITVTGQRSDRHLDAAEIAAYLDRASGDARADIESHLALCAECRAELVEASRLVATLPRRRIALAHVWIPGAAAAAVLMMLVWPRAIREPDARIAHREAPVTATIAPRALTPVGAIDSATALVWSSVPRRDRYRVRVFDARGTVIWERETTDTTANVPATAPLRVGEAYFWKVEAQTGFGRSAATELVEFSVRHARRP